MATFKTLMYAGHFVNMKLLAKGVYTTDLPTLLEDETMESLVEKLEDAKLFGKRLISEDYIANLKKCELITVTLTINK